MQAAEPRTQTRAPARLKSAPTVHAAGVAPDTISLLDALPIAAGVFGLKGDKLWIHALNARFLEVAGCSGSPNEFLPTFRHHSGSVGGDFVRAFLQDPGNS